MSTCINNIKSVAGSCFNNGKAGTSYASDYISRRHKKCVKKCVDRRKAVNTNDLSYGLVTTKDYEGITVICKVEPKVDGSFTCDAPTDIDGSLTPFYSYYNIPVNY
jgi:hypothetical protein